MRWNRNAKQVKMKKGVSKEGLLKPCVWGSAMQPWVPGSGDGRVIVQACAWLSVSVRQRSDKELRLKEQRCMGGVGKLWSRGCGNKVLHPQLFYGAIYWRAGAELFESPFAIRITSE